MVTDLELQTPFPPPFFPVRRWLDMSLTPALPQALFPARPPPSPLRLCESVSLRLHCAAGPSLSLSARL
eukprot:2345940-Rhodomonas_salina.1